MPGPTACPTCPGAELMATALTADPVNEFRLDCTRCRRTVRFVPRPAPPKPPEPSRALRELVGPRTTPTPLVGPFRLCIAGRGVRAAMLHQAVKAGDQFLTNLLMCVKDPGWFVESHGLSPADPAWVWPRVDQVEAPIPTPV